MSAHNALLTADRDRRFADWGETVTFREVVQTYDPESGQVSEQTTDTSVTAIVGAAPSGPTPGTAGQHLTGEITFEIKAEELPTASPVTTSRIVYGGTEYDVVSYVLSGGGLTYTLRCRKTK